MTGISGPACIMICALVYLMEFSLSLLFKIKNYELKTQ